MMSSGYQIVKKFFDHLLPELPDSSDESTHSTSGNFSKCGSFEGDFFLTKIDSVEYEINPENIREATSPNPNQIPSLTHPTITDYVLYGSEIIPKSQADAIRTNISKRKRALNTKFPNFFEERSFRITDKFTSNGDSDPKDSRLPYKTMKYHNHGNKENTRRLRLVNKSKLDKVEFVDLETGNLGSKQT